MCERRNPVTFRVHPNQRGMTHKGKKEKVRDEGGREVRGVCPSHAVTLSESCVENQHVSELHLPHI